MCGAAGSFAGSRRYGAAASGQAKVFRGSRLCADAELQELLDGWRSLGVYFASVSLLAEGKDSRTSYDMDADKWTVEETVLGSTALVLKTTADGFLILRLAAQGFSWEHVDTYRRVKLKVVDSAARRFQVDVLRRALEDQNAVEYAEGTDNDFASFAKGLFVELTGKQCEGERPHDPLAGKERPAPPASGGKAPAAAAPGSFASVGRRTG
mmetsp:Transcript_52697/g.153246  ORF Transcript_52697/g.153246 Transcript_52697/m.153246 type:complete len:210 (-) Transcript_52697:78-707(-)